MYPKTNPPTPWGQQACGIVVGLFAPPVVLPRAVPRVDLWGAASYPKSAAVHFAPLRRNFCPFHVFFTLFHVFFTYFYQK